MVGEEDAVDLWDHGGMYNTALRALGALKIHHEYCKGVIAIAPRNFITI
jgi:hypothetical protein